MALDLDNAISLFGNWVKGKMAEAEQKVYAEYRNKKGRSASTDEIQRARTRAWSVCVTGKGTTGNSRRRRDAATVQRNIMMLTKIKG